jgi:AraC-like DNA-binding protein
MTTSFDRRVLRRLFAVLWGTMANGVVADLGVLGVIFWSRYASIVRALPAREEPLVIELAEPALLHGVTVARYRHDGRLLTAVKDRHASVSSSQGRSEWWARGQTWSSRPGSLQLKLPGEVHRETRRDGPAQFKVVLFEEALVAHARRVLDGRPFAPPSKLGLVVGDPAARPLLALHTLLDEPSADRLTLETALTEALASLIALTSGPTPKEVRRFWSTPLRRAKDQLLSRYTEPLSLDQIANDAGIDKFHLCRAFRDEIGLPPHAYLVHVRIARAQELLRNKLPASRVAAEVGIYDQSQLNRHFKRIVGVTPGQYARAFA